MLVNLLDMFSLGLVEMLFSIKIKSPSNETKITTNYLLAGFQVSEDKLGIDQNGIWVTVKEG